MPYTLNRQAFERLKSMTRAGLYTPKAFKFSAADSNALLGPAAAPNWTEFGMWFLGIDDQQPKASKDHYAYPYGKSGTVYLDALKQAARDANRAGDAAIAAAVNEVLDMAKAKDQDAARASRAIAFRAPVKIAAAAAAADGSPARPPTFAMQAYTGNPMQLEGWEFPVVVDLSGIDVTDKPRPILKDHDPCKVVGHSTSIVTDGKKLDAAGIVSGVGEHVDEVVRSAANGFPWQASIGASVVENDFIPVGQKGSANGRSYDGPVNIARRTSLGEISFVALGADDDTSARIAAKKAAKGTAMDFDAWLAAKGFKAEDLTGAQSDAMKAMYKAETDSEAANAAADKSKPPADQEDEDEDDDEDEDENAPAGKKGKARAPRRAIRASRVPALDLADQRRQVLAERKRVAGITAALDSYRPRVESEKFAPIEAAAIAEGWDADKTELALIRAARPTAPKNVNINSGAGADVTPDIVAAACARSGGIAEKFAFAGLNDRQKEIAASKPLRRMTIFGLCATVAASAGVQLTQHRMDDDVIRQVFELEAGRRLNIRADGGGGGAFSTLSLSGITENILNKSMLQAYGTIESVVDQICYQTDTNDFKQFKRYRLTASGDLQPVTAAGELKNLSLQDESYANQVSTIGAIINLTRQILINDDMGALTDIPTIIGRKAALAREKAVFNIYFQLKSLTATGASVNQAANSFNFVSTGAKNYLTGSTSALQISSMTSARQKFVEQKDANGDPIMVPPDRVLVPPALETVADNLFQGANIVVGALGSTSSKSTEPNLNAHRNKYRPIVSPYLGANSPLAGTYGSVATDTQWSLLANPEGGMAPIQIGYLRGQRVPVIERGEANFNTLGIAMRCFYDFGVAGHDWRTIVWADGQ